MSKTIDERVVSMQFDNKKFEANVSTTMNTLDKLKQKLKMEGASKGLEKVEKSVKNFKVDPIVSAIEKLNSSFSGWGLVAKKIIWDVVSVAENAGKRLVSSLSVDQISAGWEKYGQKTTSVQTIMNATGKSIDEVNGYLDKLMWFSDETSYGFTDMTQALGQFTSAGANIDNVIPMLTGIANATAFAGKSASDFSRVLYNLNQSYSGGFLNYMDWKSVELAGVASKELKQALIDAGIELGTLTKDGKAANGELVTIANLGRTLNQQWANTAVMEKAFGRFGAFTEEVYKLVEDGKVETASEGIAKLSGKFDALSEKAFKSAQEAKTFEEAIEATKDAVSSGWMKTFDLIFGNYEQAKVIWTDLANGLWDFFASGAEKRNEILTEALTSPWDKFMKQMNNAGVTSEKFIEKMKDISKRGSAIDYMIEKNGGSLEKAIKAGDISYSLMQKTFAAFKDTTEETSKALDELYSGMKQGANGSAVEAMQSALKSLGYDLGQFGDNLDGVDGKFGSVTKKALTAFQEANGLTVTGFVDDDTIAKLKELTATSYDLSKVDEDLLGHLTEMSGREKIIESFANVLRSVVKIVDQFKNAWRSLLYGDLDDDSIFEKQVESVNNFADALLSFTEKLILSDENADKLMRTFRGLFSAIDIIRMVVGGGLNIVFTVLKRVLDLLNISFLDATANIGDAIYALRNWIKENDIITKSVTAVVDAIFKIGKAVYQFIKNLWEMPMVQEAVSKVIVAMRKTFSKLKDFFGQGGKVIKDFIGRCKELDGLTWDNFKIAAKDFFTNVVGYFLNIGNIFSDLKTTLGDLFKSIHSYLRENVAIYRWFTDAISAIFSSLINKIKNFNAAWLLLIGMGGALFVAIKTFFNIITFAEKAAKAALRFAKNINYMIEAFTGVLRSTKAVMYGVAAKQFGKALIELAAALLILSRIPTQDIVKSVLAIVVILGATVGAFILVNKLTKMEKISDFLKLATIFTSFGVSMLALSFSLKIMDKVSLGAIGKSVAVLIGFGTALRIINNSSYLKGSEDSIKAFAKVIKRFSSSMFLLAIAMKIMDSVSISGLANCLIVMYGFSKMINSLISLVYYQQNIDKVGKFLQSVSFAFLLMAVSVKILGKMSMDQLTQGTLFIYLFAKIIEELCKTEKKYGDDADKIGKMMTGFGASFILMAFASKILGNMSVEELTKGVICIALFGLIVAGLSRFGKNGNANSAKLGVMMLAIGGAFMAMAIAVKLMTLIKPSELDTVIVVLVALTGCFAALMGMSKYTKNATKTILSLSIALLAMATALGFISLLSEDKLIAASISLSLVMGVFALLIKMFNQLDQTKAKMKNARASVMALTLCILGISGAIVALGGIEPERAIVAATGLSAVLGVVTLLLKTMENVGSKAKKSITSMLAITGVIAILSGIMIALSVVPGDTSDALLTMIGIAGVIALMATVCSKLSKQSKDILKAMPGLLAISGLIAILSVILIGLTALGVDPGAMIGYALGLTALAGALAVFALVSKLMKGAAGPMISFAGGLIALSGALVVFSGAVFLIGLGLKLAYEGIKGIIDAIRSLFKDDLVGGVEEDLQIHSPSKVFDSIGSNIMKGLLNGLDGMKGKVIDWFKGLPGKMLDWVKGLPKKFLNAGKELISGLGKGIKIGFSKLMEFIKSIPGLIVKGITALPGLLVNAGKAIGNLILKGLNGLKNLFVAAGKGIAGLVKKGVDAFKGLFKGIDYDEMRDELYEKLNGMTQMELDKWMEENKTQLLRFQRWGADLLNTAKDLPENLKTELAKLYGLIPVKKIDAETGEVITIYEKIPDAAKNAMDRAGTEAGHVAANNVVGQSLVGAITDYITGDGKGKIGDELVEEVEDAKARAKRAAEVNDEFNIDTFSTVVVGGADQYAQMSDAARMAMQRGIEQAVSEDNRKGVMSNLDYAKMITGSDMSLEEIYGNRGTVSAEAEATHYQEELTRQMQEKIPDAAREAIARASGETLIQYYEMGELEAQNEANGYAGLEPVLATTAQKAAANASNAAANASDGSSAAENFGNTYSEEMSNYDFSVTGESAIDNTIEGMNDKSEELRTFFMTILSKNAEYFDSESGIWTEKGEGLIDALDTGVQNKKSDFQTSSKDIANSGANSAKIQEYMYRNTGRYLAQGLIIGMLQKIVDVRNAGKELGKAADEGTRSSTEVRSPSKKFLEIGMYCAIGMANGLTKYAYRVKDASEDVGKSSLDIMSESVNKALDSLSEAGLSTPTIRPVMDLSNVQSGVSQIGTMFNGIRSVNAMAGINSLANSMNNRQNGTTDILNAIDNYTARLAEAGTGSTYNINGITYDDGTNVATAVEALVRAARIERRI